MIDTSTILRRLDSEQTDERVKRIRNLLRREDTRLVSDRPSKLSVSEALRLWTTRLQNTDVTGQHLDGAELFVSRLKSFTPQRKLEQFALISSDATGNLFFDLSTRHFVGAVIINAGKRRKAPR